MRQLVSLTLIVPCIAGCRPAPPVADIVVWGGPVHTMGDEVPTAGAVAIRDGRIVFVGDEDGARRFVGTDTRVMDLAGGALLPGLHDTHVHPVSGGIELGDCDLNAAETRDEVVGIVSECVARSPGTGWIRGGGFQLPLFPNGAPSRALLDSIVPDRPAYLTSADAHTAWVNTRALELAGVGPETPDPPPDGEILRTASGQVQGTLRESAMDLVARHVPEHTALEVAQGLRRGLDRAASFGLTTVHDAGADSTALRAYAEAADAGTLTARVIVAMAVDPAGGPEQVERLVSLRERYQRERVRPIAVKLFLDGVIEGGTAALLEPYVDRPDFSGRLNYEPDVLRDMVARFDEAGFQVHIHAIGDRAIRAGLDAFEALGPGTARTGPPHMLAHVQLVDPEDLGRFGELGVTVSMTPLWFYADTYIRDLTEPRLGEARSRWLYPVRSLVDAGALVVGGSDWSVTTMNPWPSIEVAVRRQDPSLPEGAPWIPEQRLDRPRALAMYTVDAARAGGVEQEVGSITPGRAADLVALDGDPLVVPDPELSELSVQWTMVGGEIVFRREAEDLSPGGG